MATFKVEKTGVNKNSGYLIFDKERELIEITPSCLPMLGLSYDALHKKAIYYDIDSLFPELFPDGIPSSTFLSKSGSRIAYLQPRII